MGESSDNNVHGKVTNYSGENKFSKKIFKVKLCATRNCSFMFALFNCEFYVCILFVPAWCYQKGRIQEQSLFLFFITFQKASNNSSTLI